MTRVCALPGCPNEVPDAEVTFRGGYCQQHVGEAIIDAVENLGGRIEQLTDQADRIARALENQAERD